MTRFLPSPSEFKCNKYKDLQKRNGNETYLRMTAIFPVFAPPVQVMR